MFKKVVIFLDRQILKLWFFLGIKYELLLDPPPPPSLKFVSGAPGGQGGSNIGSYFIPQKIPTSELVYPKNNPTFFSIPKKIPHQQ